MIKVILNISCHSTSPDADIQTVSLFSQLHYKIKRKKLYNKTGSLSKFVCEIASVLCII